MVDKKDINTLQKRHLLARDHSEEDIFNPFLDKYSGINNFVERNWFSSKECLNLVKKINPDLILVYGTSIIKGAIIEQFRNKILNVHLGLSPYYRGSGTNYFPFFNN